MKKQLILMMTTLMISSCAPAKPGKLEFNEDPLASRNANRDLPSGVTFKQINDSILSPLSCTQCHGDMKTAAGLNNYIKAGEPFSSKLYLRMEDQTMPPFGAKADKEQLELLEAYIRELNI